MAVAVKPALGVQPRPVEGGLSPVAAPTFWIRATPSIFVVLWSSGFIGAKFGLPAAPPASFLFTRFALVLAVMLPLAWIAGAPWPRSLRQTGHLAVTGVLMHAGYLGGVFSSIDLGMSAGLAALMTGLQPVLTAVIAPTMLDERTTRIQWVGLALGLGGGTLVVADKISVAGLTWEALAFGLMGLFTFTLGTIYQKRFCVSFDLRTGSVVQFVAAALVMLPFALLERRPVVWSAGFVATLAWLVFALSIVAIALLTLMVRRGAATRVASLFYLVPPCTALLAFAAFGERLSIIELAGMALAVAGVALVVRN